jgi:dienelactone hydrolase
MTLRRLLALPLLLAAATATAQERPVDFVRMAEPAGLGRLLRPQGEGAAPLAIILPDSIGEDGRAELYAESLAARGIASLVLGLGEDRDHAPAPVDPAAHADAVPAALAWAEEAGFAATGIGVMGFGLGGRAALAAARARPAAALYPRCVDLALPGEGPALVLQGADVAEVCDALPAWPSRSLRLLPGAGHAWDAPGAIWPSPGPVLPDPAGGTPLRSRYDAEATRAAAEIIADWFEQRLFPAARSAAR